MAVIRVTLEVRGVMVEHLTRLLATGLYGRNTEELLHNMLSAGARQALQEGLLPDPKVEQLIRRMWDEQNPLPSSQAAGQEPREEVAGGEGGQGTEVVDSAPSQAPEE